MLIPSYFFALFAIICTGFVCSAERVNQYEYIEMQPTLKAEPIDPIVIISEQPLEETVSAVEIEEYVEDTLLPQEDIELIALVTMAEAEGRMRGRKAISDRHHLESCRFCIFPGYSAWRYISGKSVFIHVEWES